MAADLDAVAGRAQRRGGHEAASAAWERAAELTTEAETRARRLQNAAMSAWLGGQTGRAHVLAEDARRYAERTRSCVPTSTGSERGWNGTSAPRSRPVDRPAAAQDVAPSDGARALEMAMLGTTLATFAAGSGLAVDPPTFLPPCPTTPRSGSSAAVR